jgi:hypothetical protein
MEQKGKTFNRPQMSTHEHACLTSSQIFHWLCPSAPLTDLAPTAPAASNGILETDEKPMHQTTQEDLDVPERTPLDEHGSMRKSLQII